MVVMVLGWSQRRGLWGLQQVGKGGGGLVPLLRWLWLLLVRVLLRLLRMMGVVNLGSRLKIHQDGSAEERLGRRKFYSNPRDAAPADSIRGAEGKRRRMFLREEEEMSSAVYSRCYDNIWSARGQSDPRFSFRTFGSPPSTGGFLYRATMYWSEFLLPDPCWQSGVLSGAT